VTGPEVLQQEEEVLDRTLEYLFQKHVMYRLCYMLGEPPYTVHSCSQPGVVAARLTTEQPGSILLLSKILLC
jgi:hypothetical protein